MYKGPEPIMRDIGNVLPTEMYSTQPMRNYYRHEACGANTCMPYRQARTISIDPTFYERLSCAFCNGYFPAGDFYWLEDFGRVNEPIQTTILRPWESAE